MKEYIAESGGRYTYSDDILNLQELALSMTSIFEGSSNFIISGCEIKNNQISPGYVWLNAKVRIFEGANQVSFPYYIYETNKNDSLVYANEVNKRGRCNFLSLGGQKVPEVKDPITGFPPQYIEMNADYSPRFVDKFFGKYALLLESPFAKQTVKKDLSLTGNLSSEKEIISKTAISVLNENTGYILKNLVKVSGDAAIGVYYNGLLVNEIVINTKGSFSFIKQGVELARVDDQGLHSFRSSSKSSGIGQLFLYANNLINVDSDSDNAGININYTGYQRGLNRFRNLNVYNGKDQNKPIFQIEGKSSTTSVNGLLQLTGTCLALKNETYEKTSKELLGSIIWKDKTDTTVSQLGFITKENTDFEISNQIGNIVLSSAAYVNIAAELRINGQRISDIFVSVDNFRSSLNKKVEIIEGKQLSTENFSTELKLKLESINKGSITIPGQGYATTQDVVTALSKRLAANADLSDLGNKSTARANLNIYSKEESQQLFLKVSGKLLELVSLTADEINGLTPEQAGVLKSQKQAAIRNNLDAEQKGAADLRLSKSSNLSDLTNKVQARENISVYSIEDIDKLLASKLSADGAYTGQIFTPEHKKKLEGISNGNFSGVDTEGKPIAQKEGYVTTSQVLRELGKKANLLLDNYSEDQKKIIAANLKFYRMDEADNRYASVANLFQDYITHLVKTGKNTQEAQGLLRDKLDVLSKDEVSLNYIRKDGKLSDLILVNDDAKRLACRAIGAAFSEDYQTKLTDTGWLQMLNSGGSTDTRGLFVRQIGNVICIQGVINTGKRDGNNWGGIVAIIPNQIEPPKYGLKTSAQNFDNDHKHNRGVTFVLAGNSRKIQLYESGYNNQDTEINFK